ncbi:rhodanese family protein [Neisseria sp. Ec49-e6-T10]|uniref:rhodanese family protein n=1 Tax=Neisseria sp. Ec49-e6-T10 TaxID=3140744 RepID=UPI003EBA08CB
MMSIEFIGTDQMQQLIKNGALLIDIRSAEEFNREHILNAQNIPVEQMFQSNMSVDEGKTVIFYCLSGQRTKNNQDILAAYVHQSGYILEGGLNAWKKAGKEIYFNNKQPISIMRQVQIIAGCLILLGSILGFFIHPAFYLLSTFVGAGLFFAGVTGFCGMALLLMKMPWNQINKSFNSKV